MRARVARTRETTLLKDYRNLSFLEVPIFPRKGKNEKRNP